VRLIDPPIFGDDGEPCDGTFDPKARAIELDKSLEPHFMWKLFYHELTHAALVDSGVYNFLHLRLEEAICDAVATQRLQELRDKLGLPE
jgi:hypothetical protein